MLWAILLISQPVLAGQIGSSASYYNDSDDVTIIKYGAWASSSDRVSVKYTTANYNMPGYDKTGSNLGLLFDLETFNQVKLQGELGLGSLGGNMYFVGDASITKVLNKNVSIFGGVSGDVVDSAKAIEQDITYTGWNSGVEFSNDLLGVVAVARKSYYTDNNEMTGWMSKAYIMPLDGISLYVSTKQNRNSNPTGDYYSPKDYERYNIGIGFRRRFEEVTLGGFAETGNTSTNGDRGNGNAWRFYINSTRTTPWEWSFSIAEDLSDSSNYKYRMIQASIRFDL